MTKGRFSIEKITYSKWGKRSYEYAVIDKIQHIKIKGGFSNEFEAILWYIESGYSILDLVD